MSVVEPGRWMRLDPLDRIRAGAGVVEEEVDLDLFD